MWVGGQRLTPATLPLGKTPYLGVPQDRSRQVQKVSPRHRDSIHGPSNL